MEESNISLEAMDQQFDGGAAPSGYYPPTAAPSLHRAPLRGIAVVLKLYSFRAFLVYVLKFALSVN